MRPRPTLTGLDLLSSAWPNALTRAKTGLLCHPASINRQLRHAVDICRNSKKFILTALFGPQHGIWGNTQDNMIEWKSFRDKDSSLPIYSLYGKKRKPSKSMLKHVDVLLIDLQDVGARYYTFIWTLYYCLAACQKYHKAAVVIDRPNPINGIDVEGPVLDPEFTSFVGLYPLPARHGMTIGEIANYLQAACFPTLELHIISLKYWQRKMFFPMTKLPWVLPSPNMPSWETALVYPGMCLLEGTNVSEGRGTTRPFQLFGAPFIDPQPLLQRLSRLDLPGVHFRPHYFQPTFQKHAGKLCGGAELHVTNPGIFKPFLTATAILSSIIKLYPNEFRWQKPPYEYEYKKLPIDILAGTDHYRKKLMAGNSPRNLEAWWQKQTKEFLKIRKKYLLY